MERGAGFTEQQISDLLRPPWELHQRLCLARGTNLKDALKQWALRNEKYLDKWAASRDFKALKYAGCCPELLTILGALIALAPGIDDDWRNVVGSSRRRRQMIRSLERAAEVLESFRWGLLTPGGEESRDDLPGVLGLPKPNELSASLRLYIWILETAGHVSPGKSPGLDLVKYALCGYVENKTGSPHDKELSALIGASLRDPDYTEACHKMWRFRNFGRLKQSLPQLHLFLMVFESLITPEK